MCKDTPAQSRASQNAQDPRADISDPNRIKPILIDSEFDGLVSEPLLIEDSYKAFCVTPDGELILDSFTEKQLKKLQKNIVKKYQLLKLIVTNVQIWRQKWESNQFQQLL